MAADEIKSYRLPSDYINVLSNIGSIGITRIEAALEDGGAVARQQLHDWREVQSHRPSAQTDGQFMSRAAEANKGVLELHFDYLNRSHPYIRLAASICYAVGFLALSIPSLDVFVKVVRLLIAMFTTAITPYLYVLLAELTSTDRARESWSRWATSSSR